MNEATRGARQELSRAAAAVAEALRSAGASLATAESCTGGLIATTLTAIGGASEIFWGGVVVYQAAAKIELAAIDPRVVARHGTVSAATTRALAAGIRRRADTTYGLAVTGWAGPAAGAGGVVGEAHVALAAPGDGGAVVSHRFDGSRDHIRALAAVAALDLLRGRLAAAQDGADE